MLASPFIAVTDQAWFEHLSTRSTDRTVDEVNFWSPSSPLPMKRLHLGEIHFDHMHTPADFAYEFHLVDADEREIVVAETKPRVGQGAFRSRLLDVYVRRCAITGEKTEPVLQAAHVQSYLGPQSNHVQNGILMTQEFHTLYDEGLVSITPDFKVRVSPKIRERWSNGKRYYECDDREIRLPEDRKLWPSRDALAWHEERVFVA